MNITYNSNTNLLIINDKSVDYEELKRLIKQTEQDLALLEYLQDRMNDQLELII